MMTRALFPPSRRRRWISFRRRLTFTHPSVISDSSQESLFDLLRQILFAYATAFKMGGKRRYARQIPRQSVGWDRRAKHTVKIMHGFTNSTLRRRKRSAHRPDEKPAGLPELARLEWDQLKRRNFRLLNFELGKKRKILIFPSYPHSRF